MWNAVAYRATTLMGAMMRFQYCKMALNGLLLVVIARPVFASPLQLVVDSQSHVFLDNPTGSPVGFDGYQLLSASGSLTPASWKSIADYVAGGESDLVSASLGAGALTFLEVPPSPSSLAELNPLGLGTLQGGSRFAIGSPIADQNPVADAEFFYSTSAGTFQGNVIYVPEPASATLLIGLTLVALLWTGRQSFTAWA